MLGFCGRARAEKVDGFSYLATREKERADRLGGYVLRCFAGTEFYPRFDDYCGRFLPYWPASGDDSLAQPSEFSKRVPYPGVGGLRIPTDQDIVSSRFVSHRVFPASVSLSENYVCVSLNWFVCLLTTGITCTASLVAV